MSAPVETTNDVIAALRESKGTFAARLDPEHVHQTGPLVLENELRVPDPPEGLVSRLNVAGEPVIEMFVADKNGSVSAMGGDEELNAFWEPTVVALTSVVRRALEERGVTLTGDIYITTSLTVPGSVIGDAHLDDDQFQPHDGVGVAAIVSNDSGPRFASCPVSCAPMRPGLPVQVRDSEIEGFAEAATINTGPHQPVIFPQFGQLHAGPAAGATTAVRNLFVLRAATQPAS